MVGEGRTGTDCLAQDCGRRVRQGLHSERRGRDHNTGRPREVEGQVGWVWGTDMTPEIKDFKCESKV